ncbi:unnamed protein product [Calicophoron daubneyi]|uniref:tRNA (adenine(58)-N(1))-methyltransferase catalytic subunit TRMT61A n=1 Tax=Calicophoron daubneyi TaxID=300641 RepID=A0AAV2T7W3_CALDB
MAAAVKESRPFVKSVMAFGDCAIVVTGKHELRSIILTKNEVTQTRFGALRHNECVGKKFGSKISTSRGHVHLLHIDPVLWAGSLPHRTQIIYPPDASLIVGGLDLSPGMRVFEAGTGSGSLTHFLAQAVWPNGHVNSFEFHSGRVESAAKEIEAHSLSSIVSVAHRDVCSEGFPEFGEKENSDGVDAVVLDLPQPWLVIPRLSKVYRPKCGGRLCSFSPCIEQVQRTCTSLREHGFIHLRTVECLQRNYDVVRAFLNVPNMGQIGATSDNGSDSSNPWINRTLLPPPCAAVTAQKRLVSAAAPELNSDSESEPSRKQPRLESLEKATKDKRKCGKESDVGDESMFRWEALLESQMSGHKGYLTFASWLPRASAVVTSQTESGEEGCEEKNTHPAKSDA